MDDLLKTIEDGDSLYDINHTLVLTCLLQLAIKNNVYLRHVIDELYPNETERKKIVESLNSESLTEYRSLISEIVSRSKDY